jgi:hypothetical protein
MTRKLTKALEMQAREAEMAKSLPAESDEQAQ